MATTSLLTNLVSYWPLDESSGNAADSVGGNTLVNQNTTTFGSAKILNGATVVRASNQGFQVADNAALSIVGNLSISCWVSFTTSTQGHIVTKFGGAGNRSFRLWTTGTTNIQFGVSSDGTALNNVSWTVALSTGTFYHLVLIYTASTHLAELYLNGISQGTQDVTSTSIFDSTAALGVGIDGGTDSLNGKIDEVGLWSKALTSSEAIALYNGGIGYPYGLFPSLFPLKDVMATTEILSAIPTKSLSLVDSFTVSNLLRLGQGFSNVNKSTGGTWTNQSKS